jgi:hypothetical protein
MVLLRDLYELWPDLPATMIAGDSLYDTDPTARMCEVDYGLHPIFRLHEKQKTAGQIMKPEHSRDGSVHRIDGYGRLVCTKHGKVLPFETAESSKRVRADGRPLYPGQASNEGGFRIRARCDHGPYPCGRVSLRMGVNWNKLTHYPHYPEGNPKRHAEREAMLVRLNGVESIFNRVKSGNLATAGAARTRIEEMTSVEALLSLSLLGMTGLAVADQRLQAEKRGASDLSPEQATRTQARAKRPRSTAAHQPNGPVTDKPTATAVARQTTVTGLMAPLIWGSPTVKLNLSRSASDAHPIESDDDLHGADSEKAVMR